MARYVITKIDEEKVLLIVEQYRYTMNGNTWNLMFTHKVNKRKVDSIIEASRKIEPTLNFYKYICYDELGQPIHTIYTSHIYLFDN